MVDIDFDKPRKLHFDLAAIRDLEAAMGGKPLSSIVNDLHSTGVTALVLALWAGLKHEDRTLNPKLVERMLERYILKEKKSQRALGRALSDAIKETGLFREDEEESEGNGQEAATA